MDDRAKPAVSTLRIEPYLLAPPSECKYYYGSPEGEFVWRISVDNKQIAGQAYPFTSSDDLIELQIDPCHPYFSEGSDYAYVRRAGPYVFWLGQAESLLSFEIIPIKWICVFDVQEYRRTVDSIPERYRRPSGLSLTKQDESSELKPAELAHWLKGQFPDPQYAIYRDPKLDNDGFGRKMLRRFIDAFTDCGDDVRICSSPQHWTELQIGVDPPEGFCEVIWLVGKTEEGVAVRFVEFPTFPLWLCGEVFNRAFASEPFLQE